MENNLMEESTSSPEDFPANPSRLPARKREQMTIGTSGRKCFELYKSRGPLGSLAKMLLTSPIWSSPARKLTWKVSATTCNHLLFRLVPSAHLTDATEFGLLPTPLVSDARLGSVIGKNDKFYISKTGRVQKVNQQGQTWGVGLACLAVLRGSLIPTPTARDWKGASGNENLDRSRLTTYLHHSGGPTTNTSYPHPSFVEAMMGFPEGWTDLDHSETP